MWYELFVKNESTIRHNILASCNLLLSIMVDNLSQCLIYKSNFIIGIYVKENIVYIMFKAFTGVYGTYSMWISGAYYFYNISQHNSRFTEQIKERTLYKTEIRLIKRRNIFTFRRHIIQL